jgi:hypothetical protein
VADKTADDDLDLKPADAGAMFRVEMFLTNALLGYWKHLVALVVVVLLGILIWGQYTSWYQSGQRAVTAEIARAVSTLPAPVPYLPELIASGQEVDLAKIEQVGDDLVAIANGATGAARVEGLLLAAELFRMSDKVDKQRSALAAASEDAPGALRYAAESGLANLELAQGEGDAAVKRLRDLAGSEDGFLAEQAMIDLGMAYEQLGRDDEAGKVYDEFLTRFPKSTRTDQVQERKEGLGEAPAPSAPAPEGGAPTEGAPTDGAPAPAEGAPAPAPTEAAPAPGAVPTAPAGGAG